MGGWIKIYRDITSHWIWQDANKLKWWLDIILMANHKDKKFLLGKELVEVKRGSFHTSEVKLSERWGVSRNTVRNFLGLLEKDGMIEIKSSKKGTTLKVMNYNTYQDFSEEEKTTKKQPAEQHCEQIKDNKVNTNKNVKNVKNEKKKDIAFFVEEYAKDSKELLQALKDWVAMRKKQGAFTERALKLNLNSLDELSCGDEKLKIAIINQSVANSWKVFFPLKQQQTNFRKNNTSKFNNICTHDWDFEELERQESEYIDKKLKEMGDTS